MRVSQIELVDTNITRNFIQYTDLTEENETSLEDTVIANRKSLTTFSRRTQIKNLFTTKGWNIFYLASKRIFDICCGLAGCIALLPIMLIVKIVYLCQDDFEPVLFKQERIGLGGKKIYIYKIRSMVHNAEQILDELMEKNPKIRMEYTKNKKLQNDPRVTKIGSFLRKTSIDEIPQFINVLKGDMTLIGPRPYLPREIEDMKEYYEDIIQCKPGITGLWQVSGRSDVSFENRCKLDSFYRINKSMGFDTEIFFKTFDTLLKQKGAK